MSLLQSMPFEILQHIFQYLPKVSLLQCAIVCRSWKTLATQLLYYNIELSKQSAKKTLSHFVNQAIGTNIGTNIGTLVKTLKINTEHGSVYLNQQDFLQLLSYIPFIKAIELDTVLLESPSYLDYLLKRSDESIQYLEELIIDDGSLNYSGGMRQYFPVAYSFRSTLKNLSLYRLRSTYDIGDRRDSAVHFLTEFTNLTHLSINNQYEDSDSELSLYSIIQSCPNLICLDYKSNHLIPEESSLLAVYNQLSLTPTNQITAGGLKLKKLQNFTLQLPNINELHMTRILSYLPVHGLQKFNLHLADAQSGIWVQHQNKKTLEQLGKYMGNTKEHAEICILSYRPREYTFDPAIPSSTDAISRYFPMVGLLTKSGQSNYSHHVCVNISDWDSRLFINTNVRVEKNDNHLFLSYELNTNDFQAQLLEEQAAINALVPICTDGSESSFNAKMLNSMDIYLEEANIEKSRIVDILKSAIATCPKLEFISFSRKCNFGPYFLKFGCAPDVSSYNYYNFTHDSFPSEISTVEKPASMSAKEKLQYGIMANANIRPDSLTSITNLLPNLRFLKLINCEFEKNAFGNYTLDIRGTNHLNQLVLDIEFLKKDLRYVFIKVEMLTNQVACYEVENSSHIMSTTIGRLTNHNCPKYPTSSAIINIKCRKLDQIDIFKGTEHIIGTVNPKLDTLPQ